MRLRQVASQNRIGATPRSGGRYLRDLQYISRPDEVMNNI